MLEVNNAVVNRGKTTIVKGVSFDVETQETIGIVGPNGCGKSTLLYSIYKALPLEDGKVLIDDQNVAKWTARETAQKISVVQQDSSAAQAMNVYDTVRLGLFAHRTLLSFGGKEDRTIVMEALEQVGMTKYAHRPITQISGGERQRVLIARAIVQNASHILLDEPTNHLDLHHQYELLHLVRTLGRTCVIVLHDLNLASTYCDRIVMLQDGQVVASGTPREVFTPERITEVYRVKAVSTEVDNKLHLQFSRLGE